jgi:HEAT repeat protein
LSRSAQVARALAVLCGTLLALGCENNLKPGAATIFEAIQGANPTPYESAEMALDEYDATARYRGTLALANENFAGEPVYIALFERALADTDPLVRMAAVRGLANHGEPRHVESLVPLLKDSSVEVRVEAARALQRLHGDAAADPLIVSVRQNDPLNPGLASESEPEVRAEAAVALGQYDEARVLRALIAALDDTDLSVNRNAQRSLKVLTGQDFGLDRIAWLAWLEKADSPFLARGIYTYPVYNRKQRIYEYLPFVPRPPNEVTSTPTGLPR